ncbi:hypothetical protein PTI98_008384 [Pleurotus ostreatus]|nr:hypothetical protein PTI98_008384 [Pleurotus ostreatus]
MRSSGASARHCCEIVFERSAWRCFFAGAGEAGAVVVGVVVEREEEREEEREVGVEEREVEEVVVVEEEREEERVEEREVEVGSGEREADASECERDTAGEDGVEFEFMEEAEVVVVEALRSSQHLRRNTSPASSPLSGDDTDIAFAFACRDALLRERERADADVGERVRECECECEDLRRLWVSEDEEEPV